MKRFQKRLGCRLFLKNKFNIFCQFMHFRELKKLTAAQFMEVWEHYDEDGKFLTSSDIINTLIKIT